MICDKCGCHDRVTRTVNRGGMVIRIRRCHNCGNMIETEEKPVAVPTTVGQKKKKRGKRELKPLPPQPPTDSTDPPSSESVESMLATSIS